MLILLQIISFACTLASAVASRVDKWVPIPSQVVFSSGYPYPLTETQE